MQNKMLSTTRIVINDITNFFRLVVREYGLSMQCENSRKTQCSRPRHFFTLIRSIMVLTIDSQSNHTVGMPSTASAYIINGHVQRDEIPLRRVYYVLSLLLII